MMDRFAGLRARIVGLAAAMALAAYLPIAASPLTVGVVPSNAPDLPEPVPRNVELSIAQIAEMVRRAVDLSGGMGSAVPDTARLVLIKPNIGVDKPSGSGVVTDVRVVRAVALLVHEAAPQARILVAEGPGGWMSPSLRDTTVDSGSYPVVDGFDLAGYRDMVTELKAQGLDIECYDLNFDHPVALVPQGGGLSLDEYQVAASVLEADAWINCPVAKTHGAKITCCMKNQFGTLPGKVYGWNKARGTSTHRGLPHAPRMMDETFVDLLGLTEPDLNVVDMVACAEAGAFQGTPKRFNLILAGRDAVAVDLVAARLMGFNPDDFEFAYLAWQQGMGPGSIDRVLVRGGNPEQLSERFKKASVDYTSEWAEHAAFGMGPRHWILRGPLPLDHEFGPGELLELDPTPGGGDWSDVVWFGDDRIDLDKYYDDPTRCVAYAFTHFTMVRSDSVRFWIGSDEGLDIWIDGKSIYHHEGRRRHVLGSERIPGYVEAGEHRVLVRATQTRGRFDFSINICEPIDDVLYAGNRYPGVRYQVRTGEERGEPASTVAAEHIREDHFSQYFDSTLDAPDPVEASRAAPDSLLLTGVPMPTSPYLLGVAAEAAGLDLAFLDSVTLAAMSQAPFHMGRADLHGWYPRSGPELGRLLSWLGLRYDIRAGFRLREALKTIKGWLASGRVPLTGRGQDNWFLMTGYRERGEGIQIHNVASDSAFWGDPISRGWWAAFPGRKWQNCPVVVVEWTGEVPTVQSLTDSMAALALDLGTREWVADDPQPWGTRLYPGGLAAWDAWVIVWDRLPLTEAWVREDQEARDQLVSLQEWNLQRLVEQRELASAYFEGAAASADADRAAHLRRAAAGYAEVAVSLRELGDFLPQEDEGDLSAEDAARLAGLPGQRHAWRQARAAERRALGALGEMLGRPELPPIQEDPLRHRNLGKKLYTWKASLSRGVEELILRGEALERSHIWGYEPEGEVSQVLEAMPRRDGWQAAVEIASGQGVYRVLQQPDAANGWTTILHLDDGETWQNSTELILWAVPIKVRSGD